MSVHPQCDTCAEVPVNALSCPDPCLSLPHGTVAYSDLHAPHVLTCWSVCPQVPADGTVTFTLAPSSTPLGTVPVVPGVGSAVARLTVPFVDGATYGYGAHAGEHSLHVPLPLR